MIGQNMGQMKKEKEKRKRYIKEIISKYKVFKQEEVVELLKSEYKVDVKQSTVSRDLREMDVEKDPNTKAFILGERVVRNQEAKALAKVLREADVKMVDSEMKCFLLRGKKQYLAVVAEQLEQFFAVDDINVSIFIGYNDSLLVYYKSQDIGKVERYLKKIFNHIAK